jgi:ABC-type Fe3+ transport system permease subunit
MAPMAIAASSSDAGRWLVTAVLLGIGLWLVVGRRRWAREVYTPPLSYLGRAGPAIVAGLGLLLIVAAVWAALDG